MPSIIVHPATASQWAHGSGGQLADCLAACADRIPRGPLVHIWSADSQPRTISLRTGLSCYANHSICSPEVTYLVRERPPQTASDHAIGHATGHVWSGVILRVQGTATLPLGVGYLGLGRLTARF